MSSYVPRYICKCSKGKHTTEGTSKKKPKYATLSRVANFVEHESDFSWSHERKEKYIAMHGAGPQRAVAKVVRWVF